MALRFLAILAVIHGARAGMSVLERHTAAPAGFVSKGAAPPDTLLTLRVALTSNDISGLEERLMSVSTPGSAEFREWLGTDEVKSFVAPSPETVQAFNAFATANELKPTVISPNGDWVSITLPVSKANQLFDADYQVFAHSAMSGTLTRTLSISLPQQLAGHVDVIHPSTAFSTPRNSPATPLFSSEVRSRAVPESCNSSVPTGVVTPTCLQDLYGIPSTPATEKTNSLLVTAYEEQFAQQADLQTFLSLLRPDIPPTTAFSLLTVEGGVNPQNLSEAGTEASLDIQYTTGIATDVPITFLSNGEEDFFTALLDTALFLDGVETPPKVVTTSYSDLESSVGLSLGSKICSAYMALGARGVSVIWSSGDGGVHGHHDTLADCNTTFIPLFPSSCPFITSVGSTQGFAPEHAINFTGGGFSNFFERKAFQDNAVEGFIKQLPDDFPGMFNRTGRAYPDVSVQGWNFEVVAGGKTIKVGGTSASAPTFAGIVALVNDRLIAAGKPVLGFLNPFLYTTAGPEGAFTDITVGHNSGFVCPATAVAFDAAVGWDPLTGFGTPKFAELVDAAFSTA
ncbi:family S53 protease-like protein [Roridomyces roridus]|uniref:tripeptidyl-peptidase II n=1 Tax=Roridomyces roridus TaxID=1738132 RepID=A0AAD7CMW8_9AGAR|nr:family S53 protease-like protein [Roridomyces roridus]